MIEEREKIEVEIFVKRMKRFGAKGTDEASSFSYFHISSFFVGWKVGEKFCLSLFFAANIAAKMCHFQWKQKAVVLWEDTKVREINASK